MPPKKPKFRLTPERIAILLEIVKTAKRKVMFDPGMVEVDPATLEIVMNKCYRNLRFTPKSITFDGTVPAMYESGNCGGGRIPKRFAFSFKYRTWKFTATDGRHRKYTETMCLGDGPSSWRHFCREVKTAQDYFTHLPVFINNWHP